MEKEDSGLKSKIMKLFDAKNGRLRNFVMLLLAGICLMIIVWPTSGTSSKGDDGVVATSEKEAENNTESYISQTDAYTKQLEQRLSKLLSSMNGVGDVQVMITLKDNGENIVEKDKSESSVTDEGSKQNTYNEETVNAVSDDYDGPYVKQVLEPNVEGVLICCTGGGDADIVLAITEAVQALFDVPVHKIVVLESN
ncbi:MAG: stage III sporulation protein AG [Coprococcus sp.]|nr:stage III sporulation protein AG [Coprococcus sp.]